MRRYRARPSSFNFNAQQHSASNTSMPSNTVQHMPGLLLVIALLIRFAYMWCAQPREKRDVLGAIQSGASRLVVSTHSALFTKDWKKLGLVVIDEQHKISKWVWTVTGMVDGDCEESEKDKRVGVDCGWLPGERKNQYQQEYGLWLIACAVWGLSMSSQTWWSGWLDCAGEWVDCDGRGAMSMTWA
eukprot:1158765-Pelagomonas_calceolata.AAC.3